MMKKGEGNEKYKNSICIVHRLREAGNPRRVSNRRLSQGTHKTLSNTRNGNAAKEVVERRASEVAFLSQLLSKVNRKLRERRRERDIDNRRKL